MTHFDSIWEQCKDATQDKAELERVCKIVGAAQPKSYLEIGTRMGTSLYAIGHYLPHGARITSVDLVHWPTVDVFAQRLKKIKTKFIVGCSVNWVDTVKAEGPFDVVLIDGDHSYDGAKADYENYGDAPLVLFHDIASSYGCAEFWREIKGTRRAREIVTPGSGMGFGVLN